MRKMLKVDRKMVPCPRGCGEATIKSRDGYFDGWKPRWFHILDLFADFPEAESRFVLSEPCGSTGAIKGDSK